MARRTGSVGVDELAEKLGVTPRIRPVTTADVTMRASRPRYCALSNARLAAAGFEMVPLRLDDNLTIPVLSGFFIWGFLKIFG